MSCCCCYSSFFCSECVGTAWCNTELCSSCITGGALDTTQCSKFDNCGGPLTGSGVGICSTGEICCQFAFAGTDANCNEIYQRPDGTLVYSDGSPATRCDIQCNEGACKGTVCNPCSPRHCGTTDQPPKAGAKSTPSSGAPSGGGSGGGTAKPSGGASNPSCTKAQTQLTQAMSRLGSTISSLLAGGTKANTVLAGQKPPASTGTGISSNMFLLIIVIVGGLLLVMAFGHKPVPD
jgi:hypothetical protein